MSDMDEATKPQRTSDDAVHEMSVAEQALRVAHDEVMFMRNEAIARAYEENERTVGRPDGPGIARRANGINRTYPRNIWKGQPSARLRRRAEYPDQVEVLVNARTWLNYAIREARMAAGDPD